MATSVATASPGNVINFNAQGTFIIGNNHKAATFHDISGASSTNWNSFPQSMNFPGQVSSQGDGEYVGIAAGCTCIAVTAGGLSSQSVMVAVAVPLVSCLTPCP
jgi:hypothetical protein